MSNQTLITTCAFQGPHGKQHTLLGCWEEKDFEANKAILQQLLF